jgi:Tfp pilus assembly protein PilX
LLLGVAASVVANVLHALDNPISQAIAAWPPLALLLTVELISRVPVHRPLLTAARVLATAIIAGIAAWVSYWHMAGVASRYGETGASPYLLPLSVDGLIVVASICLVELGGRISELQRSTATADQAAPANVQTAAAGRQTIAADFQAAAAGRQTIAADFQAAAADPQTIPAHLQVSAADGRQVPTHVQAPAADRSSIAVDRQAVAAQRPRISPQESEITEKSASHEEAAEIVDTTAAGVIGRDASAIPGLVPAPGSPLRRSNLPPAVLAEASAALPRAGSDGSYAQPIPRPQRQRAVPAQRSASPSVTAPAAPASQVPRRPAPPARQSTADRKRRDPAETVAIAAQIKADRPGITETQLAGELGMSPSTWRKVRREAAQADGPLQDDRNRAA